MQAKYERLKEIVRGYERVAVAFSGGVDSTFLLKVAYDTLGKDNVIVVTLVNDFYPERETKETDDFCISNDIRRFEISSDVLSIPGISHNPENRCYLCKTQLFGAVLQKAKEEGIEFVAEGSNVDDMGDYRPGMKAVEELKIKSPLREAGLTKYEIRALSKELGLPTWQKPSFACLASRFVYGDEITVKKLKMVDDAEQFLFEKGFNQFRVRIHGESLARIEVPAEDLEKLLSERKDIIEKLSAIGFTYITMDMKGYRTGAMNETLSGKK